MKTHARHGKIGEASVAGRQRHSARSNRTAFARRAVLVLLGLVLGVCAYAANARVVAGNQLPMPFGYGLADVLSGSMEPTFSKGTLLVVRQTSDVQQGDVVVYQDGRELVVHRVVGVQGDTVVTQGDANNVADEPFDRGQVKGVVVAWVPWLGTMVDALRSPVGIVAIIVCALALVELSFRRQQAADNDELERIKQEIRALKEEASNHEGN